jgi:hypothetical protein
MNDASPGHCIAEERLGAHNQCCSDCHTWYCEVDDYAENHPISSELKALGSCNVGAYALLMTPFTALALLQRILFVTGPANTAADTVKYQGLCAYTKLDG